jgi:peptidoglycan/LPS O-acetylase OafA/YrhL
MAAMAVVVSHVTLGLKDFGLDPFIFGSLSDGSPRGLLLAGRGVTMFFVLSGFLITYLLQAEKELHPIDIRKFYVRRILRIWPLYYLYLFIAVIIIVFFGFELNTGSLLFYLFYTANIPFILNAGLPFLQHYWSLGVEEQFYLFWPWVNKRTGNSIITVSACVIALLIGCKVYLHVFHPGSLFETAIHVTRFHCMMVGALGAILYKQNTIWFLKLTDNKPVQALCWLVIVLVATNRFHIASVIDTEIISLVTLIIIIGQVNIRNRIISLENNILDYLGKISYGIYVIHPLLIFFLSKILGSLRLDAPYKYLIVYAVVLGSTVFLAHLSFTWFESYFLTLKKKFTVIKSASSRQSATNE